MSHMTAEENSPSRTEPPHAEVQQLPHGCEPLLTEKQLSDWLGISLPTLQRLRSSGTGPRFVQLSERRIAYRRPLVEQWLEQRTALRAGAEVAA